MSSSRSNDGIHSIIDRRYEQALSLAALENATDEYESSTPSPTCQNP